MLLMSARFELPLRGVRIHVKSVSWGRLVGAHTLHALGRCWLRCARRAQLSAVSSAVEKKPRFMAFLLTIISASKGWYAAVVIDILA